MDARTNTHIHMPTHTHTHVHTRTCTHQHTHTHTHMYMHTHITPTHTHKHIYTLAFTHTCIQTCTQTCKLATQTLQRGRRQQTNAHMVAATLTEARHTIHCNRIQWCSNALPRHIHARSHCRRSQTQQTILLIPCSSRQRAQRYASAENMATPIPPW
jgi:hypothetical protein